MEIEKLKELFLKKKIELLIGYTNSNFKLKPRPYITSEIENVDKFILNSFCTHNLVKYLFELKGKKTGIFVKGCDSRTLVVLLQEKQLTRDEIFIIGIKCNGIVSYKKVLNRVKKEVNSIIETDDKLIINDGQDELLKSEYLFPFCESCEKPVPEVYDMLIDSSEKKFEKKDVKIKYQHVIEFEKLSAEERWKFFKKEMEKCIRCYACRQVCPLCYCKECFADSLNPKWANRNYNFSDSACFQIGRLVHISGRCVLCGACERACPMDIKLTLLNEKVVKIGADFFNFIPGINVDEKPLLGEFKPDDYNEFIR